MVERLLAKEKVAGSIPVSRFFFCKIIGPFYDLAGMTFCEEDLYFCKREVQAPLKPLQLQGFVSLSRPPKVGLGRFSGAKVHRTFSYIRFNLKSPSVGSTGKRSTGPFSESVSPRLVLLLSKIVLMIF